ncbi:MAG TPA: cystathionine beta-lyase [Firmicutes bacterium]|nr:cystathionine beta-lyase [Bacillota bacterium]
MQYNFDQLIDRRNTNSGKHDCNMSMFGTEDVLDMWVADMDFPAPTPVVEAIKKRAEHPIYGYSFASDNLYDAIVNRVEKLYGWKIKKEWIVFNAGVVNGLYSAVQAFARTGDELIVQAPVYYPFFSAIRNSGCQIVHNPLKEVNGRYEMDFEGLEKLFEASTTFPIRRPRIKALVLCSPHNPAGRVWTKAELRRLADICLKHDCLIFSDEIHCDLLAAGFEHTPTATLSPEIEQHTITFMSGSKTYNIAGLATSYAIIPNDKLRAQYSTARSGHNSGNLFGYVATEAALTQCDDYLEQLRAYIDGNFKFMSEFIEQRLPSLRMIEREGTYLAWVDLRALGMNPTELQHFIRHKARLALDDGYAFGPGGEGFQRFNLACPRSIVEEALLRLEKEVNEL